MSKWLGKRTQAVQERLSKDARRTEEDPEFQDLSSQTEATQRAVLKLMERVPAFLHPNPNARLKATVGTAVAKMRKTAAEKRYPHASGELSSAMLKGAEELPPDSAFGQSLRVVGDALGAICEAEHEMDAEVHQNLMSPMRELQEGQFKELLRLKKKLNGRRLDYDYKLRKAESGKSTVTTEDVRMAKGKYEESKTNMANQMMALLDSDLEQVGELAAFVSAYIANTRKVLEQLLEAERSLEEIMGEAESRPKREARPPSEYHYDDEDDEEEDMEDTGSGPRAIAAYDFEAENEGELSFKENDVIKLISRLDENWLEGEVDGRVGIFPSNYVEVLEDV